MSFWVGMFYERAKILYLSLDVVNIFQQHLLIIHGLLTLNNSKPRVASNCSLLLAPRLDVSWGREGKLHQDSMRMTKTTYSPLVHNEVN